MQWPCWRRSQTKRFAVLPYCRRRRVNADLASIPPWWESRSRCLRADRSLLELELFPWLGASAELAVIRTVCRTWCTSAGADSLWQPLCQSCFGMELQDVQRICIKGSEQQKALLTKIQRDELDDDAQAEECSSLLEASHMFQRAFMYWASTCSAATALLLAPHGTMSDDETFVQRALTHCAPRFEVMNNGVMLRFTADPDAPRDFAFDFGGEEGVGFHVRFGDGLRLERDFTVEAWLLLPSVLRAPLGAPHADAPGGTPTHYMFLESTAGDWTGFFVRSFWNNGKVLEMVDWDAYMRVCDNGYHHVAFVRHEGVLTLYHDGQAVSAVPFTPCVELASSTQDLFVGSRHNTCLHHPRFISDLRIDNGVARYCNNFRPKRHFYTTSDVAVTLSSEVSSELSTEEYES